MIDKSGEWWKSNSADDIGEYLRYYEAGGYAVARVVSSSCESCSSDTFGLKVDDTEGYACRACSRCGTTHAMLDSVQTEDVAEPEVCACPCGSETFNIAVGYAIRPDDEVRWVSIGCRCTDCGLLGCYTDWKINYGPTDSLFTSA